MLRSNARLLAAACCLGAVVASASPSGSDPESGLQRALVRRIESEAARAADLATTVLERGPHRKIKKLAVESGDLLSASERQNSALRIRLEPEVPIKRARLKQVFVPRGVDYHAERGLLAVAAVSRVLIYDMVAGSLQVIASPGEGATRFGFANDVLFVGDELFVADMGATLGVIDIPDGAVWKMDLTTLELTEVATRGELVDPGYMAVDGSGRIHVLDRGAGSLIVPVLADRWDVIYRLAGKKRLRVVPVYTGTGLQATAYEIDSQNRHWIASVTDLSILQDGELLTPCGTSFPFRFATAMALRDDGAWVLDGADTRTTERRLWAVDSACTATLVSEANKLRKSRGLVRVPDPAPED